jgi:type II secretory pathway pseudopilin PulG
MGVLRRHRKNEAGFTVIESVIALSLVFVVLMILLDALTAGSKGLVTGRQRGTALALANVVLEDARARAYVDIGHDLDSDPTLPTDPLITGTAPNYYYAGVNPPEPLAASVVDAGGAAGTNNNKLYPFSPHISLTIREGTRYTTSVYVTTVTPAQGAGDPFKRLSVKVAWTPAQYSTARSVSITSYLYNAVPPPDPRLTGQGEAAAGTFTICAAFDDCSQAGPYQLHLSLPFTSGTVDSAFVKSADGTANSGAVRLDSSSATPSGPSCTLLSLTSVSCNGPKADASADDDAGTPQPETDEGTASGGPYPVSLSGITATLGSGAAKALATGRSCWACQPPSVPDTVGDNDLLPYFAAEATGLAGGLSIGYPSGTLAGLLGGGTYLSAGTSGCTSPYPGGASQPCSASTVIDRDQSGGGASITSTATVSYPPLSVLAIPSLIPQGVVKIPAAWISAATTATSSATTTSISGTGFNLQVWTPLGYQNVPITPGSPQSSTTSFSVTSGLVNLAITANIHADAKTTSTSGPNSTGLSQASAASGSWLVVDVNVVATALGFSTVNFWLHLDLGRVASSSSYQAYIG